MHTDDTTEQPVYVVTIDTELFATKDEYDQCVDRIKSELHNAVKGNVVVVSKGIEIKRL
jgi:hypothetical protein